MVVRSSSYVDSIALDAILMRFHAISYHFYAAFIGFPGSSNAFRGPDSHPHPSRRSAAAGPLRRSPPESDLECIIPQNSTQIALKAYF